MTEDLDDVVWLHGDISTAWQEMIQSAAGRVRVFSPYITAIYWPASAVDIESTTVEIHTRFEAELFASGASTIAALREILDRGYLLFHLPQLHAKMLVIEDEAVVLGSQNMTHGGRTNLEQGMESFDESVASTAWLTSEQWRRNRRPITPGMLDDMEERIAALLPLYAELQSLAAAIDLEMLPPATPTPTATEPYERQTDFARKIDALPMSNEEINCEVTVVADNRWALVPVTPNASLTLWEVPEMGTVELVRLNYHLVVKQRTGEFRWARVAKTRITILDRERYLFINIMGEAHEVWIATALDPVQDAPYNVKVEGTWGPGLKVTFHGWLDVDGLTLTTTNASERALDLLPQINSDLIRIERTAFEACARPRFHSKSYGTAQWFGTRWSLSRLTLAMAGAHPVIVVR